MLLADVQARLRITLTNTLVDDWSLLSPAAGTSHPSQRTIAYHLGWHLRGTIERSWDIDCEYDRSGMTLESSVALSADAAVRTPDLIVHRRGRLGPEDNLLLIEVVADRAAAGEQSFDHAQAIQHRFGYRYAVLVDLRLHDEGSDAVVDPTWHWSTLESGLVTPVAERVYTDDALAHVTARARRSR